MIDLEKEIKIEQLARTDDSQKFMAKLHLDVLLRGGKLRQDCFIYALGKVTGKSLHLAKNPDMILSSEERYRKQEVEKFYSQMLQQGFWEVSRFESHYFDENGEEVDPGPEEGPPPIISKIIEVRTTERYFLDPAQDIRPLKKQDG